MTLNVLEGRISSTPTPDSVRRAIINGIFRADLTPAESQLLKPYFDDWYEEQCDIAHRHVSIESHKDILDIVDVLLTDPIRVDANACLTIAGSDPAQRNASIDLAARVWLSISIGSLQQAFLPYSTISWKDGKLSEAIRAAFDPKSQLSDPVKLPKDFNAANLERIGGLQVIWTSNLADHLSLKDDDTKVMLYHQASFLELHKSSGASVIPRDLIDETILSLALLIPSGNRKSRAWFNKKKKELHLDPKAGIYGPLNASARQIEKFHYWRDRLVILKQTFDESEPHTIALWWNDDRKKVQWYTFWIAALVLLLTIIFGLIASVSSIVQAWAAVKALPS